MRVPKITAIYGLVRALPQTNPGGGGGVRFSDPADATVTEFPACFFIAWKSHFM